MQGQLPELLRLVRPDPRWGNFRSHAFVEKEVMAGLQVADIYAFIPSALLPSLFLIVRHLATFNLLIRRTKQCEPDGFRPARS
jgi:hypothetical protein